MPPLVFIVTTDWGLGTRVQWMVRALCQCSAVVLQVKQACEILPALRPDLVVLAGDEALRAPAGSSLARALADASDTYVLAGSRRLDSRGVVTLLRGVPAQRVLLSSADAASMAHDCARLLALHPRTRPWATRGGWALAPARARSSRPSRDLY